MVDNKRKAQLIIIGAFVLGIVVGASGQYLFEHRTQSQASNSTLDDLTRAVRLTPEQRVQADQILTDSQAQYQEVRIRVRPQFNVVRDATRKRIASILSPEQQVLFEQYTRELDAKKEAKEKAAASATPKK